ncbi:phytoene/squalene synthase family protein [Aureimonas phyllosphaerae]|uniref:Phytoene synthase n=1 Tax=Aureimonas phyllosphaerae TaxID=1166078 RepID=A0A7W6BWL1_9HYPH|nr:phytoene/squalene synthase family protein [Aureimonas phyllosphaerae]MBB3935081.1 phytoene synthase [Aureimonas phyllosphaerae]MBB3959089.1 phytoene synthase [Aureimonas phyllosphaerae]SFF08089.1 phytoene synthase [Aureimonas phyllosphaerae]
MTQDGPRSAAYAECERIVQDGDPDRAVSVGFAAEDRRDGLWALYAFAHETAAIPNHVSQPLPGEIRLQWWRDRLTASDAEPEAAGQGSPVATALIETVRRYDLPVDAFERYLDARIFDLYSDPMGDRREFEAYAGETQSAIVMLSAMILDRSAAPAAAEAAGHAGVAAGAALVLRDADRHRARHQVFVPADILGATGLDASGWLNGGPPTEPARQAMIAFAQDHLTKADAQIGRLATSVRPALLPALYAAHRVTRKTPSATEPLRRLWFYWRTMRR